MRVLITGAAGFAGRHAAAALARRGNEVTGTDIAPPPAAPGPEADRPTRWLAADLARPDEALRVVESAAPEAVLHLAAQARVGASFDAAQATLRLNAVASLNLLEAVRRAAPAARVVLPSSGDVYGPVPADRLPIREEEPLNPVSPYAVSKCAVEFLGRAYRLTHAVDVVVLRLFNHTGPGQAPHFVCADFARQIARAELGLEPPVVSTGRLDVVRDFLDVRDVAEAYAGALDPGRTLSDAGPLNVASGRGVKLRDMLDLLRDLARRPVSVREDPARLRAADIPALIGDAARFRERTGWSPGIPLRRTLEDLLEAARARERGDAEAGRLP
jgi:GDP-4-dehydro-6-deoxy-D-mannose reductase